MPYRQQVTLPPEIWNQILGEVPRTHLSKFLGICVLFHDIVIKSLFSSVKIYFIGGDMGLQMLNTTHVDWTEETAMKLMSKSWEVLNHICQEPRFAKIVKCITVIAFADGQSIFERLSVANALLFMPNLHTFRWIGNGPPFDNMVGECLPNKLKNLVVQSSFPLESMWHLNDVTSLHLPMPFFFPDDEEAHDSLIQDFDIPKFSDFSLGDVLDFISPNLQSLRITATQVRDVPIRILMTLKDLEILSTVGDQEELVGLDIVFRHATRLESLTLVGLFVPEIFSFLPHHSVANLPLLTSFRISLEEMSVLTHGVGDNDFQALCGFLQGRLILRRLYVRIPAMRWTQTSQLLSIVRELTGIEVLGLHTGRDILTNNDVIEMLASSLSSKLRALHIAINWGGGDLLPLVDAIGRLPQLSFLHLYGVVGRLPILIEDLVHEAKGLQMVGLNRALWDIERVGSEIVKNKHPRWKIKFCVEEDFLCGDDAWLFKYN